LESLYWPLLAQKVAFITRPEDVELLNSTMIELVKISKAFGGTQALRDVDLTIRTGEVHALCGENGAGKSTLIKCLAGVVSPDTGTMRVNDTDLRPGNVRASESAGIAVIHQESVVFPDMNAVDNVFVGRELRTCGGLVLDRPAMRGRTRELLQRLGEDFDVSCPLSDLTLAQRQMTAMARALSMQCHTLIMDEPTASLSERETHTLLQLVRDLRGDGISILYVSHRLEEVFEIADRVTVLRDGMLVETLDVADTDRERIIQLMVGREVEELMHRHGHAEAEHEVALEVRGLGDENAFADISFSLRTGEILGLAGLVGAGRSEIARAVFGIDRYTDGDVHCFGRPLRPGRISDAIEAGIAMVPEDRQHEGLMLPMTVQENLTLTMLHSLTRGPFVDRAREKELVGKALARLMVKTESPQSVVSSLSGGNQQKVVIAKWLATEPRVLILDEPTRGIDVGAKAEIHRLIRALVSEGMAVLLISSDLPELLTVSDRIVVVREGRISGELAGTEATQERVLELALPDAGRGAP